MERLWAFRYIDHILHNYIKSHFEIRIDSKPHIFGARSWWRLRYDLYDEKEEDFGVSSFGLGDESPLRMPKGFNRKELERIQPLGT